VQRALGSLLPEATGQSPRQWIYSPLVWYILDGTRVAYKVFNHADNPEPGGPPIDFPSYQFIEYAGGGKWRSEEDVWIPAELKQFAKRYAGAANEHPQTLEQQLRREDWGSWVGWTRSEPGRQAAPSWLGKDGFTPFSGIQDIDFGVRSH
jgi:hypothetical protein